MRAGYKNKGVACEIRKIDLQSWLADDAVRFVGYMVNHEITGGAIRVTLPANIPDIIPIEYEEELTGLVDSEDTYIRLTIAGKLNSRVKDNGIHEESPFSFILRYYLIDCLVGDFRQLSSSFIFPPSRGPILTEQVVANTGMYAEFQKGISELRRAKPERIEVKEDLAQSLKEVLDGKVEVKENKFIYQMVDGSIPLSAAAASIREVAMFELLIENIDISKTAIMIEEPEAHLHPLKQRMMADIIALMLRDGASMQVTTHSDYFLRRVNELLLQNRVRVERSDKYEEMCEELNLNKNLYLQPSDLSTYFLQKRADGYTEIIMQSLEEGVPYAAFHESIRKSLEMNYQLEKYLDDGSN